MASTAQANPTERGTPPGEPLQEGVITAAAPAANASTSGTRTITQPGYVSFVAPLINAAGGRARLYGVLTLTRARLGTAVIHLLWAGYIRATSGGRPSLPGAPCEAGDTLTLTVFASTSWAGVAAATPSVLFRVTKEQGQVLPVIPEPPGPESGPGDAVTINLGDPATGADYAAVTVGAQTLDRVKMFAASPSVKTNKGSLMFAVTDGTNLLADVPASIEVGATGTNEIVGVEIPIAQTPATAITVATSRVILGLPSRVLYPAYTWQLKRDNPHAADEWGAAFAEVERWATP